MKRFDLSRSLSDKGVDINISPLIDVVFLLLIFFVVTTVFVEETGVTVTKPTAVSAEDLDRQSLLFALTESGDIVYGGRTIALNAVRGIVTQQLREGVDLPVVLIGDTGAQLGKLVELIDECKRDGAGQVSIAARKVSS